ncbi:MAG TPA: hypothetical protein VGO34_11355 [Alphaproteobacteria bacterium]|jgi:hypothetical protein
MASYPILDFIVRHGRTLALALAAATLAACLFAAVALGSWLWLIGGVAGGVLVYGFVASYAELVRLVTDMLMPK